VSHERKIYTVQKFENPERGNSLESNTVPWHLSEELLDFAYPWENKKPPFMEFKAIHDGEWLYCFFRVIDRNVKVFVSTNEKREVIYGDRVEIFFTADESLADYYCLEIDPHGRVYDYRASFYRDFDDKWSWPSDHMLVRSNFTEVGYDVMIAMSLKSLMDMGVLKKERILTGIFRGKCSEIDLTKDTMRWISWQRPESTLPDFHIPSSFGEFHLEQNIQKSEMFS
jgi:hypothetical protein